MKTDAAGPRFGPAGRGESFAALGYKKMADAPAYLARFGLTAFEYQCGHGVKVNVDTMAALAREGVAQGIAYSLHAPYYISMASPDAEKRANSLRYLLESARAVELLGGNRVVFHSGTVGKMDPKEAMALVKETLVAARKKLDEEGFAHILLCPEVMGKYSQIGGLEDVIELCRADERHIPCVDFGHLNSRMQGALKTEEDFGRVADAIGEALGGERGRSFHVHFSKIEFTKAGERRHLTFEDTEFGPPFEPFVKMCAGRGLAPVVICESAGTQTEDAAAMMEYYNSLNT